MQAKHRVTPRRANARGRGNHRRTGDRIEDCTTPPRRPSIRVNLLHACGSPTNYGYAHGCRCQACRGAQNERMKQWMHEHPGYRQKYPSNADCHEHVCPVCGKTFKNHKDKAVCYCSVKCWRLAQVEVMRSRLLPILHPNPAPYSWLPTNHPAMLMQQRQTRRLFVGGTCARCGRGFVVHSEAGIASYCSRSCARGTSKDTRRAKKRGVGHESYRRIDIFERDGWRCHICGRKTRRGVHYLHPLSPTIDHLVALGRDGRDAPDNLACAHRQCNTVKNVAGGAQLLLIG